MDHPRGLVFRRPQAASPRRAVVYFCSAVLTNKWNTLAKSPSPVETLTPRVVVCFTGPWGVAWRAKAAPFSEWVGDLPLVITLLPDLVGLPARGHVRSLTMGTYALYTFLRLFDIERLFLTGFTMFGAAPGGAGDYHEPHRHGLGIDHDLDAEAKIFADIVAEFGGQLSVTPEVEELLTRHGFTAERGTVLRAGTPRAVSLLGRLVAELSWVLIRTGFQLRRLSR